jgi:hypothetical protein
MPETAMSTKSTVVVTAIAVALGLVGTASASDRQDDRNKERGGFVVACSLSGVNPVYHPEIFGNPAVARSYGFVRAPNGVWQVMPGCRPH